MDREEFLWDERGVENFYCAKESKSLGKDVFVGKCPVYGDIEPFGQAAPTNGAIRKGICEHTECEHHIKYNPHE